MKTIKSTSGLLAAGILALASGTSARAAITTVPSGLNPGDTYRLVFVTSTTRDGLSADIADYNTFVSNAAATVGDLNALGTSWTAIASTGTVNANENTLTRGTDPTAPIYRLDGLQVALGNDDLWDATIANSISITEAGNSLDTWVWTGTTGDGTKWADGWLGLSGWRLEGKSTATTAPAGNDREVFGDRWTASMGNLGNGGTEGSFYAISGMLTVPVPEPSVLALLAAGGLLLARRRRV